MTTFDFYPPHDFQCEDEEKDPPYVLQAIAELKIKNNPFERNVCVHLCGRIHGPKICLQPDEIDFGEIYVGERHYKAINAVNIGKNE